MRLLTNKQLKDESSVRRLSQIDMGPKGPMAILTVLASAYTHLLMALDDAEIHTQGVPFPLCQGEGPLCGSI